MFHSGGQVIFIYVFNIMTKGVAPLNWSLHNIL